jgi:hypothetical protein
MGLLNNAEKPWLDAQIDPRIWRRRMPYFVRGRKLSYRTITRARARLGLEEPS